MFGIGSEELFIIIIFSILVFDPDKLPEAGRRLGRAFRYLRKTKQDMQDVVQKEVIRPLESLDDQMQKDVKKIEKTLKAGSFEELLGDSISNISDGKETRVSGNTSDKTSQDDTVQKMADLLYGIDNGEEDAKDK